MIPKARRGCAFAGARSDTARPLGQPTMTRGSGAASESRRKLGTAMASSVQCAAPIVRRRRSEGTTASSEDCHGSSLAAKRVETAVASYPPADMVRTFSSLGSPSSKRVVAPGIAFAQACTFSIGLAVGSRADAARPGAQNPSGTPSASAPATMTSPSGTTPSGTTAAGTTTGGTPLPAPNAMASMPAQDHAERDPHVAVSSSAWALDNSTEVRIAKAQTGIADAQVEEFRAPLLPQVTANGQISYGTTRTASRPAPVPAPSAARTRRTGTGALRSPPAPSSSTTSARPGITTAPPRRSSSRRATTRTRRSSR